jgi:hypothetical protein
MTEDVRATKDGADDEQIEEERANKSVQVKRCFSMWSPKSDDVWLLRELLRRALKTKNTIRCT